MRSFVYAGHGWKSVLMVRAQDKTNDYALRKFLDDWHAGKAAIEVCVFDEAGTPGPDGRGAYVSYVLRKP